MQQTTVLFSRWRS